FSGKPPDDLDCFRLREVERQAALVAVDRLPAGRKPASAPCAAYRRAGQAPPAAPLYLDDVGPKQRELVARIGASQHLREVENFYAFERSGHVDFLLKMMTVIARSAATKQSILSFRGWMDCFASLAMTTLTTILLLFDGDVRRRDCRARSPFAGRIRRGAAPILPGSSARCCCSQA